MEIRRNADRLTLIYTALLSRFGSATSGQSRVYAGLRRYRRDRTCTQLPSIFFWSEKGGFVRTLRTPLGYVPDNHRKMVVKERLSKPNIRFGSGRTGSKIVSKFRLTHNRKLRSANRNTIYHTIGCPALLLWCPAVENRGPRVSQRMFFVKLCKYGGLLLPSPRSLVIPWPTPLAHSFTDDGHVPAENLLLK